MDSVIEEWRPVKNDPRYDVSNLGRVRSKDRVINRIDGRRRTMKGVVLKATIGTNNNGYCFVSLGANNNTTVHSLVAAAFIGPRPEGKYINHLDGDKTNNKVENLEYCTPRENFAHAIATGLAPKHKNRKVRQMPPEREKLARVAHQLVMDGMPYNQIAKTVEMSKGWVTQVVSGRIAKHLNLPPIPSFEQRLANRQ